MTSTIDGRIDAAEFRQVLSHYASGITVIAGIADDAPVGFTCQSFYSVSTTPPLVSFSVMKTSTSWPQIRDTGRFSVNVLSGHQHDVSNTFARSGTDKWAGIEWHRSPQENPIIEGTVMWLDCEVVAEHEAGDHTIVIGHVRAMSSPDWHHGSPLLYFRGSYRHLDDLTG